MHIQHFFLISCCVLLYLSHKCSTKLIVKKKKYQDSTLCLVLEQQLYGKSMRRLVGWVCGEWTEHKGISPRSRLFIEIE